MSELSGIAQFKNSVITPFVDERGDERRPAGLMRCAQARACVAVEILVEQNQILPVRIFLELSAARRRPRGGRLPDRG